MDTLILFGGAAIAVLCLIVFILILWVRDRGKHLRDSRSENWSLRREIENSRWERRQIDQSLSWLFGNSDFPMRHGRRSPGAWTPSPTYGDWILNERQGDGPWGFLFAMAVVVAAVAIIVWVISSSGAAAGAKQPTGQPESLETQRLAPALPEESAETIGKQRLAHYLAIRARAAKSLDDSELGTVLAGNALEAQRDALALLSSEGCYWDFQMPKVTHWEISDLDTDSFDAYVNIRENAGLYCKGARDDRSYTPENTYYGIHLAFEHINGGWFISDANDLDTLVGEIAD
ncbi:MAG: DUF4101 domain-containing protein [Anaerolineae bacterium]|nr:DUF4101 domain-containing protein [Anaerolineae bacterium]